jgi:hypothetical protein
VLLIDIGHIGPDSAEAISRVKTHSPLARTVAFALWDGRPDCRAAEKADEGVYFLDGNGLGELSTVLKGLLGESPETH